MISDGKNKDFDGQNLQGLNLENANLENISFIDTNLENANLQGSNLTGAFLVNTSLKKANLMEVKLTDACIDNWDIAEAQLDDIDCQYVYLKFIKGQKENRLPNNSEKDFLLGEFTQIIQSLSNGFDLEHTNNTDSINIEAVILALQKISQKYQDKIEIIGVEKKENIIAFKVKNEYPNNVNEIKKSYPDAYKEAVHDLQNNSEERLTTPQYENIKIQLSQLLEKVQENPTIYLEKLIVPERGITVLTENINNQILWVKIQEFKKAFIITSLLTSTNQNIVLEEIKKLEEVLRSADISFNQAIPNKSIRIIRGVLSQLPPSKLAQIYSNYTWCIISITS